MELAQSDLDWKEYFMRHVYLAASKSKDPRTKIGAVLVKDGIIISEGFNGFARGVVDRLDRYENKKEKYIFTVHGEANAVLNAVRHGINTQGSTCYTQAIPCHDCTKMLIQAGISRIIYHTLWPMNQKWIKSIEYSMLMLNEVGILYDGFDQKLNIFAKNNGRRIKV